MQGLLSTVSAHLVSPILPSPSSHMGCSCSHWWSPHQIWPGSDILTFVHDVKTKAETDNSQTWWVFLDEINTCDHLGLITELMCNLSVLGSQLPKNIVFIAACNPYPTVYLFKWETARFYLTTIIIKRGGRSSSLQGSKRRSKQMGYLHLFTGDDPPRYLSASI